MPDMNKTKKELSDELAELRRQNAELKAANAEHRTAHETLRASEDNFRQLLDQIPLAIGVAVRDKFVFLNKTALNIAKGFSPQELQDRRIIDFYPPDHLNDIRERRKKILKGEGMSPVEQRFLRSDGTSVIMEVRTVPTTYEGRPAFLSMGLDITKHKQAEKALLDKEKQLKRQAQRLEEVNTALKVLLEHREQEKVDQEENVLATLKRLVFPYLDRLKQSELSDDQEFMLSLIESNLNTIASPLARRLSSPEANLTHSEAQVAGLIREGKTTKEIARLLNLSTETVSFHRKRIRAKLGIVNKKVNLRSHIESLHQRV